MAEPIVDRLVALIDEHGPIPVSQYLEHALYGPDGFYMAGGRAGRGGDFLTAPEVGPLFGAVVAGAVDTWWRELGSPSEFTVVEGGAGPGTLARAVVAADPEVLSSGALRWFMVERADAQRAAHPTHAQLVSVGPADAPSSVAAGVVFANELLDNLAFDIVERARAGWREVRIGVESGRLVERVGPEVALPEWPEGSPTASATPVGTRLPVQRQARAWVADARARLTRGRVVVFDYGGTTSELVSRDGGWLRTHRSHDGGNGWLAEPGSCDITTDVDVDQLQLDRRADRHDRQSGWLRRHGIEDLVEEGRATWNRSAGIGDLAALRARSRIREADALLDPDGMGGFHVLEWVVDPDHG